MTAQRSSERDGRGPRTKASALRRVLLYRSLPYFMSQVHDAAGRRFEVAEHHEAWCRLVADHPRLVLLAPRGHGKSTLVLVLILWLFYRHGHHPDGRARSISLGSFQVALFSATRDQTRVHVERFRDLLAANADLVGAAQTDPGSEAARTRASMSQVRLTSGAELLARAFGASTRGLHPDVLVLDDVLSEQNSGSHAGREAVWRYFVGTLLPMDARRILVVGTALHQVDLMARLRPRPGQPLPDGRHAASTRVFEFGWQRYRALDVETGATLWPARFPSEKLRVMQAEEPTIFSREYQNDPRDDTSSLFPHALTQAALDAGATLTFVPAYRRRPGEIVVAGVDLARSERAGADWTVVIVAAYDRETKIRRILTIRRHRGLTYREVLELLVELAVDYQIDLGIVEQNGFQAYVLDGLRTALSGPAYMGHQTGREKWRLDQGVPAVKLPLLHGLWVIPTGDADSHRIARIWQAELGAFGWSEDRLVSAGEHDDCVMATWFVELAIRFAEHWIAAAAEPDIVTGEDLGIQRVNISPDY